MNNNVMRATTVSYNQEYKQFKATKLYSWTNKNPRKFLYFKTSDILKSIGVNDSVSSLINSDSSSGSRYKNIFERVKQRGKCKGATYFSVEDMREFMKLYEPRGEERRGLWQVYVDWIQTMITEHERLSHRNTKPKRGVVNTLTATAKMLGIGIKKDLVPFLIEKQFLYRHQGALLPFERKINQKLFEVKEVKIQNGVVPQVFVTEKGYNKIKQLWKKV